MPRKRKETFNEKPWARASLVLGVMVALVTVLSFILDLPGKLREFIGPTQTPTSISFGNSCNRNFNYDQFEYANIPELQAIPKDQSLRVELHFAGKLIGIDLGCEVYPPFSAQVETSLIEGDANNFTCLAFGGKPALHGTLESYNAFCISGEKKWLLLQVDNQSGMQTLDEGVSNDILVGKSKNLLAIQITETNLQLFVNGHSVPTTARIDLVSNHALGLAWAIPENVTLLPIWQVDNLNAWELDNNAPPTSTDFSMAFVNVSYRIPLSPPPSSTTTPQQFTNLHITTPIQISEHITSYILLDQSMSMVRSENNNNILGRQLLEVLIGIAPPQDLIGVATFADQTKKILSLTRVDEIDPERLKGELFDLNRGTGNSDNLASALNFAYNELQGQPNSGKKHVVVVTDNRNLSATPNQENQFRKTIQDYRDANIQLDIIILEGESLPGKPFESLLKDEGVNFVVYDATRLNDSPGVALNAFYHNYTHRPGDIRFTIDPQHSYQLEVPPNADKFVFFLSSTNNGAMPLSASAILTTPSGDKIGHTLATGFSTFIEHNPQAGLWTIEVSSSEPVTFNGYSLILLSSIR